MNNRSNVDVIVLGAGMPSAGTIPAALVKTAAQDVVLDWIIAAFKSLPYAQCHFVGGYGIDSVAADFPDIKFHFNADWSRTGAGGSLLIVPMDEQNDIYVCYSDTVFGPENVDQVSAAEGDVVIAVDRSWRRRFELRAGDDLEQAEKVLTIGDDVVEIGRQVSLSDADSEFTGLMKLSTKAIHALSELKKGGADGYENLDIPGVLTHFLSQGLSVRAVDVGGNWAELNHPEDLARFALGSKAQTLAGIRPLVKLSIIDPLVVITGNDWESNKKDALTSITRKFPSTKLAVRSSAIGEDSWDESHAGEYITVLDVDSSNDGELTEAVEKVFRSYPLEDEKNQVLVQEMLVDVKSHGVILTRSPHTGAAYYTVEFDDSSGDTTTVTGGSASDLKKAVVFRDSKSPIANLPSTVVDAINVALELERIVDHDALDIEFAITADDQFHVMQLRPIVVPISIHDIRRSDLQLSGSLAEAQKRISTLNRPMPHLLGSRTILGVMPDWNPAEIIGTTPRRLALSLYRNLVTDRTWAIQRRQYGYRDVTSHPLLHEIIGRPYIDTRAVFNSFIPETLDDGIASRLVNHYLDELEAHPESHDKVEFDIAITCLGFDFDSRAISLRNDSFQEEEIRSIADSLRQITTTAISRRASDQARLAKLLSRYQVLADFDAPPLSKALMLLDDCRRFGVLPFAHMARSAFIAVDLLRGLERIGVTTSDQTARFLESTSNITSDLEFDARKVSEGDLEWDDFVQRYGHVRPGTYDITVSKYADNPDLFLKPHLTRASKQPDASPVGEIWDEQSISRIDTELNRIGLAINASSFGAFVRQAIEDRERSKFEFTRNLSRALDLVLQFGEENGLGAEELSHLELDDLRRVENGYVGDARTWLIERSAEAKELHTQSAILQLPSLIVSSTDVTAFLVPPSEPSFITTKRVSAPTAVLMPGEFGGDSLEGKIVMIPQADPGYDWLFGHGLAGLITMFGGANSHMSIRSSELGLPAAIGLGETAYAKYSSATSLRLDCEAKRIEVLSWR